MGASGTVRDRTGAAPTGSIAYWVLVGSLAAVGVAAAFTIGAFLLATAAAPGILGIVLRRVDKRVSPAALIGSAAAPLYIAWLNRRGPGVVCDAIEGGVQCTEQWSPWPFVVGGLTLAAAAAVLLRSVVGRGTHE
jgi:hypothetical protein